MLKQVFYPFLQRAKKIPYIIVYIFFKKIYKVDSQKIILASNTRKELSGNLLYIYNYLSNNNPEKKIKIITKIKNDMFFQFSCAKEMSNAKYIIIDDYFPLVYTFKIRKDTKLIQVWHACGAFKKVGYSRKMNELSRYSLTHKNYTDAIVSSEDIRKNYSEAFGIDIRKVHSLGVPRTDMFFDETSKEKIRKKLFEKMEILKGKRAILFAPTFRGNNVNDAYYPEEFINIEAIYKNLKANEIFVIKMHPFIKNKIKIEEKFKNKIIDITDEYREINDLLLVTDLLITDYSSVIFEYSFLNKPLIFYTPDYEDYKEKRDFYYIFDEYIYGKQITEFDELLKNLNYNKIEDKNLEKFKEKFLSACDGNSTQRILKEIID